MWLPLCQLGGLVWMGRECICLHLFAISACPSFIDLSPLRASQSPAALAPESDIVGAGEGLCTPTLCMHTHTHIPTGDTTALLTKPFCFILTVTIPFLCLHLLEVSQHHRDHERVEALQLISVLSPQAALHRPCDGHARELRLHPSL